VKGTFAPKQVVPSAASTAEERRRQPRQRIHARAWFDTSDRSVYTRLHDIGPGGLSVRSSMPFRDGEHLVVTVGAARVRVQVRWSSGRPRAGMGFRFVEVLDGEDELHALTRGPLLY
jgi:PilZ domain-containing protein